MIITIMTINTPKSSETLTSEQKSELLFLKKAFNSSLMDIMDSTGKHNAQLDLLKVWPDTESLPELYNQLSEMKSCLDSFRPLNSRLLKDFNEKQDIKYTYESNCIEGNSLTLNETYNVVMKGLTVGGKSLNDHLEAKNHQEAIHYIRDLATRNIELNEWELKNIHSLILKGIDDQEAGKYRTQPVFLYKQDGERHDFPQPYIVQKMMEEYFIFYHENMDTLHPVEMAAHLHQKLVNIHPFIDGNGRTSRLVMNLFLFQEGYPVAIIDSEQEKRQTYYSHLSDYQGVIDGGDSKPFQLFIAQKVKESLIEHLNFFSQDCSEEGKDKGYYFFRTIEKLLKSND